MAATHTPDTNDTSPDATGRDYGYADKIADGLERVCAHPDEDGDVTFDAGDLAHLVDAYNDLRGRTVHLARGPRPGAGD